MTVPTSDPTLTAFTRAVIGDYSGRPVYPRGAIVLPAGVGHDEFLAAVKEHSPKTATIVFVRNDGVEMIVAARTRRLYQRLLARVGVQFLDIEIRTPESSVYRDRHVARGTNDIFRLERRAFSFT